MDQSEEEAKRKIPTSLLSNT